MFGGYQSIGVLEETKDKLTFRKTVAYYSDDKIEFFSERANVIQDYVYDKVIEKLNRTSVPHEIL